jgi:hypothetical protein
LGGDGGIRTLVQRRFSAVFYTLSVVCFSEAGRYNTHLCLLLSYLGSRVCIVAYTHQLCGFDTPIRHKAEQIAAEVQATYLSRLSSKSEVRFASYCSEEVLTRTLPFLDVLTQPSNSACQDRSSPNRISKSITILQRKKFIELKIFSKFLHLHFLAYL